ncbi:chaperone modulator CbpM [Butyricimonas synergistica]|uniref:chaperone modulator CbpM n=1 Tax=Butyricimonas synergistica TaxID=544644 RepID=UPI00037FBD06|nr:chaperone modulator CbpM [Butyricimonas synergistica]
MQADLIIVREYCQKSHVDPSFIISLEEDGLIDIQVVDGERYLSISQLRDLERFVHWHEDLSVNIEGIGVIHELMGRMHDMQQELDQLRREVRVFRSHYLNYLDE